jgi:hypothetical protein
MRKLTLMLSAAATLAACTEPNPAYEPDPFLPGECREGVRFEETFDDFERPERLDVVFVIDNSGDVEPMQEAVAEAVPGFLGTLAGADVEVRATVVTTDASRAVSIAPAVDSVDGCGGNDETIAESGDDDWRNIIACNVLQGSEGAPASEPLEVAVALFDDLDERVGLFRDDARKLIVVVTNEDDCSAEGSIDGDGTVRQACADASAAGELTPVEDIVASLQSFSRSDRGVALAVVSGPAATIEDEVRPVCSSRIGAVYGANRLEDATVALGDQGYFGNLCRADLSGVFDDIANAVGLPRETTFCPGRELLQEPLSVTGLYDGDPAAIRVGEEGFVFLGQTTDCPTGAIRVQPAALREAESFTMEYCVDPDA